MTEKVMVSVFPSGMFLMEDPTSGARIDVGGFTSVEKTAWIAMQVAEGALKLKADADVDVDGDAKALQAKKK
jgi:hypothetical protein